jgi:hypothetical protein
MGCYVCCEVLRCKGGKGSGTRLTQLHYNMLAIMVVGRCKNCKILFVPDLASGLPVESRDRKKPGGERMEHAKKVYWTLYLLLQ